MSHSTNDRSISKCILRVIAFVFLLLSALPSTLLAQEHEDFDQYKLKLTGNWFYSNPSGRLQGQAENAPIDIQKDLGFNSYSTFGAKADWKFTRKNHLYISISRFNSSHDTVLQRTIVFRDTTFEAGLATQSSLNVFFAAPGYQYDIIRRKRGHLGFGVQFNLLNTSAKISAQGQVIDEGAANLLQYLPAARFSRPCLSQGPNIVSTLQTLHACSSTEISMGCTFLVTATSCRQLTI